MAIWVPVPVTVAQQHGLYGLRGWLRIISLLMALTAVLAPVMVLYFALKAVLLPGGQLGGGLVLVFVLALSAATSMATAVLWFRQSPNFLAVFLELSALSLVLELAGDLVLLRLPPLPESFPQPSGDPLSDLALGVLLTAILWWPLWRSRRYRVTFEHKLRADDPLLRGPVRRI